AWSASSLLSSPCGPRLAAKGCRTCFRMRHPTMLTAEQARQTAQPTHPKPVAPSDVEALLVIQKIRETAQGIEQRVQSALGEDSPRTEWPRSRTPAPGLSPAAFCRRPNSPPRT